MLSVSTRIFIKMVPASSNVMTRASSWGMSSFATSCSWKVIVLISRVISSEGEMPVTLVACCEVSDCLSLEGQSRPQREML